ncbi:hypothetical protein BUE80_DR004610 [Diplocarpon rosae]|nr:hypothetical protein BUE80_DR004610 [Diplocarpon rosae]
MGGNAFMSHSPPLQTPRMPFHIYKQVLPRVLAILHQHFLRAASPIEAPGKADYGDIDGKLPPSLPLCSLRVLIFSPLTAAYDQSVTPKLKVAESIAQDLGAIAWIAGPKGQAMNFAIPWPREREQDHNAVPDPLPAAEKFIQLDLHILATAHELDWHLFHDAHGDLCSILGSIIRPFGLTVNHTGMHLRIPSIEAHDRKKSLIEEEQRRGDGGVCLSSGISMDTSIKDRSEDQNSNKKLKSSERQRLLKRPIYRAWMEEFIPSHLPPASDPNPPLTRDQIRAEAFSTFGPAVQRAYNTREKVFLLDKNRDDIWQNAIKKNVPGAQDPQVRSAACRFLKGVLMDEEILWEGEKPKAAERDGDGFWDEKEVSEFVRGNWEEAVRLGMLWQREKAVEGMKAKAEKKRIAAEATKERIEGG